MSQGTGWYLASCSGLCSAVLRHRGGGGASAQHCKAMTNWPNTIQCLGSDDIMSLGIKSSATEGVGAKNFSENPS